MEVQKIETAPKDGTDILALLVYGDTAMWVVAHWSHGYGRDCWMSSRSGHEYPERHVQMWAKLPEKPMFEPVADSRRVHSYGKAGESGGGLDNGSPTG